MPATCKKCGVSKPKSKFKAHQWKRAKKGHGATCRECKSRPSQLDSKSSADRARIEQVTRAAEEQLRRTGSVRGVMMAKKGEKTIFDRFPINEQQLMVATKEGMHERVTEILTTDKWVHPNLGGGPISRLLNCNLCETGHTPLTTAVAAGTHNLTQSASSLVPVSLP